MRKYPKSYRLGHKYVEEIFCGAWHIEEKIDGSQLSFRIKDGGVAIHSRNAPIDLNNPTKGWSSAVDSVMSRAHLLRNGYTYRGEYLKGLKQNYLTYGRVPDGHIIIFDIEDENGRPLPPDLKAREAKEIGLECVKSLMVGLGPMSESLQNEVIKNFLESESMLGGCLIEGVIIKNYGFKTPEGNYAIVKVVSEAFKEKTTPKPKAIRMLNIGDDIAAALNTEARFRKAVQHLREEGKLREEMEDIGPLLKEIHKDIDEEESDWIKDQLYKYYIKDIKKKAVYGFANWYENELTRRV